ncbi:MAG: hypothetical protein AB1414_01995 [bacterium]
MEGKEIGVRSDVFFTLYFLFSGETVMPLRLTNEDENFWSAVACHRFGGKPKVALAK